MDLLYLNIFNSNVLNKVIANIQLFSQQQEIIKYYESNEANIKLKIIKIGTFFRSWVQTKKKVQNEGLDDKGIPIINNIEVDMEIENLGLENGELEWEIDLEKTVLPEVFTLIEGKEHGEISDQFLTIIPGRTGGDSTWNLELASYVVMKLPAKYPYKDVYEKMPGITFLLKYAGQLFLFNWDCENVSEYSVLRNYM
jgi:hypothetical protein